MLSALAEILLIKALVVALALCLDALLGELKRWHPLVGFGVWAAALERCFNRRAGSRLSIVVGACSWLLAIVPVLLFYFAAVWVLQLSSDQPAWFSSLLGYLGAAVLLYFTLGARSLDEHIEAISAPLAEGDLPRARRALSMIVSRDTDNLSETQVATAATESLFENAHDAVIAPIFWFVLLGPLGALLFRLANTLDAMWGYRTARFNYFGRFAARVDDGLGYLSARLSVLLLALQNRAAWHCARRYGSHWYSPNAGPVMAAGAGAIGCKLGGDTCYNGEIKFRPPLGEGAAPLACDLPRAQQLVMRAYWLCPLLLALSAALIAGGSLWQ